MRACHARGPGAAVRGWPVGLGLMLGILLCVGAAGAAVTVQVSVLGLSGELLANANSNLSILQRRNDPRLSDLWVARLHEQAPAEIRGSLRPFGYYNPDIDAELIQVEEGTWSARYTVTPGPRVTVTEVDIRWSGEGAGESALRDAAEAFPIRVGDPLDHRLYETGKRRLLQQAAALGYPDARAARSELRVDPGDNSARIVLHLDTGGRYFLAGIRLRQDVLKPHFLERFLGDAAVGDDFSPARLQQIQQDLIRSGYFSLVDVNPRFDQAVDRHVPVVVDLVPAPRQTWSVSVGYDTDIQFNASLRWNHRRLNRRGHQADALMKLSFEESTLRGDYWIPIRDPRTERLGFGGWAERENSDNTRRTTWVGEAAYHREWRVWDGRFFVEERFERFQVGSEPGEEVNLLSLGTSLSGRRFAAGVFPRTGWEMFAEGRGSGGQVFGNPYLQGHLKAMGFVPFPPGGRLRLRLELGGTAVDDFDQHPSSLRFYAGGDESIRGYAWKSVGPKDETGEVIGGRKVISGGLETNLRVRRQWAAAVFIDAGNAYNDRLDRLLAGAGVGLRYLAGFGTVRLDVAWPLNRDEDDPAWSDARGHIGFEVTF